MLLRLAALLYLLTALGPSLSGMARAQVTQPEPTIRMARATWDTGWFQAEIYKQLFERLGYDVSGPKTLENPQFYKGVAAGNVDLWVNGWFPLHTSFLDNPELATKVEVVGFEVEGGALQGYLIDKKLADAFGLKTLTDLAKAEVVEALDQDGNGKADLIGCNREWSCASFVDDHLNAYGLDSHVEQVQADYSPMMLEAVERFRQGEPVLFYTFTPNWTTGSLVPGEDVVWLELPGSDTAVAKVPGCSSDPCQMGFPPNDIRAVANADFLEAHPAVRELLERVKIPLADISAQNALLVSGEGDMDAIRRHASAWLEANGTQVESWLEAAASLDPRLSVSVAETPSLSPLATSAATDEDALLRVATMQLEPFVTYQNRSYSGFSIELWDLLAKKIGIEYELYGVNSVAKLLDEVERGAADLATAGIGITSQHERALNFSHTFFESGLQIMVADTGGNIINDSVAVLRSVVFSPQLLRILGILLIVLLVAAHIMWLSERQHNPEFPKSYRKGVWEAFWWSAVTATTVGYGDKTPRGVFGRLFGLIWMFAGLFVLAYFTAGITTIFTVQELRGNLSGPQDLPGRRVATIERSAAAEYLERQGISSLSFETIDMAYKALHENEVEAIVYDAPVLQHYATHEGKGRVRLAGLVFQEQNYGIALPQDSPHREAINLALLELIESGQYRELYNKWFGES